MMPENQKLKTKVLIVDDHPVVVSGCRSLFASDSSVKIEGAGNAKAGYTAFMDDKPDITVIDIKLPDVSGFELMRQIRKEDPDARIIMFSMNDDPAFVVRAIEMGAQGYLSKSDDPRGFLSKPCSRWRLEKITFPRIWRKPSLSRLPLSKPAPQTR